MRKLIGIIVDDQQHSIDAFLRMAPKFEGIEIAANFNEPIKALTYIRTNPVDFIILDVEMEDMDGFEFIASIPDPKIQIILYTGHQEYEDKGYDMRLLDVLVKPVSESRFKGAIRRLSERAKDILPKASEDSLIGHECYIQIKGPVRYERKMIPFVELMYLESYERSVYLYMRRDPKSPLISNTPLKDIIELLPRNWFKRCHRSYVFNTYYFDRYVKEGVYLLYTDEKLPTGEKSIYTDFYRFINSNAI